MTSQQSYREFVTNHICDYLETQRKKYEVYRIYGNFETLDLASRVIHAKELLVKQSQLNAVQLDTCVVDILAEIKKSYEDAINEHNQKVIELKMNEDKEIDSIHLEKQNRLTLKENEIESYRNKFLSQISDLTKKHDKLKRLKPELENIFRLYNLNTNEVQVKYDDTTLEDLKEIIDIADMIVHQTIGNKSIMSKGVSLLYLPAIITLKDEQQDKLFKISYLVTLAILGVFAKPYFIGGIGILYIINIFANIHRVRAKEELLYLAYSLSADLDFNKFLEQDASYKKLLSDRELIEMEDISDKINEVKVKYKSLLEELDKENPLYELKKEELEYAKSLDEIREECEEAETTVHRELQALKFSYEGEILEIDKSFKELQKSQKFLGQEISESKVLSTEMKLGVIKYKEQAVAEAKLNVPLENIVFTYKTEEERKGHINFMKIMLCNVLCNIKEKHAKVTIYDSNDLGKDFAEFYKQELNAYIKSETKDFKKLLDTFIDNSKSNILKFGNKNIQEYNTESERVGKITADYNIFIILSTEEKLHTNQIFKAFMEYSASMGTWIWLINPDESIVEERARLEYKQFLGAMVRSTTPGQIVTLDNRLLGVFHDPIETYTYSSLLSTKVLTTLMKTIEENRADALMYEEGFRKPVIPDDKIWTYTTTKGIELRLGYQDGDPDKPLTLLLGDGPVHAIGAGTTGAGKSAFINQMLASLLYMYPPEELELVMIDFKNVEFKMYTDDLLIPHAKIISGTKDGEYAISIFEYLLDEMMRRTKLFGEYKVQHIADYNNLMRAQGRMDKILPRVLLIIDEFQVMFTEVDDKSVEKIKKLITSLSKLARFAGCHMFFVSQSMSGTMSQDILDQFSLRLALRCSADVSNAILGNKAASEIKEKNGYIYSNDTGANDPTANKLWRVPFIPNSGVKEYLPKLIKKAEIEGHIHRKADFFDDEKLHAGKELDELYVQNPGSIKDVKGMFILGEKTNYSSNRLPVNFRLLKDDNEHIMFTAFERSSLLNITNTFMSNVNAKDNASIIIHSADKDSSILLDLENRVEEKYKSIVTDRYSAAELIELLEATIERRESTPNEEHPTLYFLGLYWDKLEKLGRNQDWKLGERFKSILQKGSMVGVHLILVLKETKEFRQFKGMFNHKIVSYTDDMESNQMIDSSKAAKIKLEIGIYTYGSTQSKFKIYQYPVYGEIEEREVVLTY